MTKEEILQNYSKDHQDGRSYSDEDIKNAMQEYSDQQTKELREEIDRLRRLLWQVEIFMEQEQMNEDFVGIWRDDEGLILQNVKENSLKD